MDEQSASEERFASKRAWNTMPMNENIMSKYFFKAMSNPYDVTTKQGIINLGTANNNLVGPELDERLNATDIPNFSASKHCHYFNSKSISKAKTATTQFLEKWFSKGRHIDESEIHLLNGATACMDTLAFFCFDEGDVLITPSPLYGRIFPNFNLRFKVQVECLNLLPKDKSKSGKPFDLNPNDLKELILKLVSEGKNVKAFFLVNPQNPLGIIYSPELILELMEVCSKYKLHFIVDEVYGLSVYDDSATFRSLLSFENVPDPNRTHFIWSASKDFGLPGFRYGLIHSKSEQLKSFMSTWLLFQTVGTLERDIFSTIISDTKWCEKFIGISQKKLRTNHEVVSESLAKLGVEKSVSSAGVVVWADFRKFLKSEDFDEEMALFKAIIDKGVYILPGKAMHCTTPGWFRIVFAEPTEALIEGMDRISAVLHDWSGKHDS